MNSDKMKACADMNLTAAVEDLAERKNIPLSRARSEIIESGAYDVLYELESGLWKEGSDYLLEFANAMQAARKI